MRVISGQYKSRQLKNVDSKLTRATTDKNKENLFNMIGPYFTGGVCLDLFCGSGALGIEALSRGMEVGYFVDKQYKAFKTTKENLEMLKVLNRTFVYKLDYQKALEELNSKNIKFDLVFLDPPYGLKINKSIMEFLANQRMLNPECMIIVEDLKEEEIETPNHFYLKKKQNYGITTLQIFVYDEEN